MKTLILLLWAGAALFAREYWVQVISMKSETVPALFMERVKAVGLPYSTARERGETKVRFGPFSTEKKALEQLQRIRCNVAYDAFVVTFDKGAAEAVGPTVEVVPEAIAVIAQGSKKPSAPAQPEKRADASQQHKPETVRETVQAQAEEKRAEVVSQPVSAPCVCVCDKKAYKKAQIEEAVAYYRNSPHYRFIAGE